MPLDLINEKTTVYIDITFLDKNSKPSSPSSITYSTYCKTTKIAIKTDVIVTPASQITITLDALDNAIQNTANTTEDKVLTIKATYSANDLLNSDYNYIIKNLQGVV